MSNVIINKVMSIVLSATLCMTACGGVIACVGNDYIDVAEAATINKNAKAKKVYVTYKGEKYHVKNCRTIKNSKNLTKITIKKAKKDGYKSCKVCFK